MTYTIDTNKVVSEIFNDEAVIVNLTSGAYYSFKGSAITIWQLLGAGYRDEEIIEQLKDAESITKFIAFLIQENLITASDSVVKETITVDRQFTLPEYKKYDDMKDLLLLDPIHEVDQTGWPHKKAE
jgi:hypothetical protein